MEIIYKKIKIKSDSDLSLNSILLLANVKENRLCVYVDGQYPENLDGNSIINKNSFVTIYPELSGRTGFKIGANIALLAATVLSAGAGAGGFFAVNASTSGLIALRAGILIGGALLATGLQALAPKSLDNINGNDNAESPTFSLTASGNNARPFQPMPIVFGRHNIFPDFSSVPYNEFKTYDVINYDTNAWIQDTWVENTLNMAGGPFGIVRDTVTFNILTPLPTLTLAGQDYWLRFSGPTGYRETELDAQDNPTPSIGDRYRKTYVYVDSASNATFNDKWVEWEDLDQNGTSATFFSTGGTFNNTLSYEFDTIAQPYPRKTEVVKQIMNYGFGDLVFVSSQIGTTDADDYREYDDTNDGSPLDEQPDNWTLEQGQPSFDITFLGLSAAYFQHVNGNVNTVDGGRMDNVEGFEYPNNYVIRQGPEDTFAIQVDIEGRQFRLDKVNGGTALLTRNFNIEYRQVAPVVSSWSPFPASMTVSVFDPYQVVHGAPGETYRDTLYVDNLDPGQYEVRGRRIDENETVQDNISEIFLKRVRFYQRDESQNYLAQNRQAIIVESDSQLTGALNRLSSVISAKCWKNNGFGSYTWAETSNPSDWLLYYARGLFKNTSSDGSFSYPYSPTIGWQNNADHPNNGEKIAGAGISDSEIDFDSLTDWWNFCNDNDLRFDAVLDQSETIFDTFRKICAVGRASPTWALGKLGVVFENPNQLPVAMFTPENILEDSFELTYITENLPDEIVVNFVNRDDNWQQDSVRATVIGVTNPVNTQTVDFFGITVEDQAQREANRLAARQTYNRRICKFSTDGEGLIVTRGDVILVSHDLFNWDYSSRVIEMKTDENYIYQMILDYEINDSVTHVSIRLPNNTIETYAATVLGNVLTFVDLFPITKAAYYLDQQNTVNSSTIFTESVPEDFLVIAGNRESPGRPMRIVGINAKSENEFEISCIEEDPGFYAQEFTLSGLPAPKQYEHLKASVKTLDVALKENGKANLFWNLDGADAVSIMLTVNGGLPFLYTIGGATHFGDDVDLSYSTGDVIMATVIPIYTDAPIAVETKTITFTMI